MASHLTGSYVAASDGKSYTYAGTWTLVEGLLSWHSTFALDGVSCGPLQGELLVKPGRDEERHVDRAIKSAIERWLLNQL
jgi:hypothetical protein